MSAAASDIAICFSEVSGVRLALDAEQVHAIADVETAAGDDRPCIDLAVSLGLAPYPPDVRRRGAVLGEGPEAPLLLMGDRILVDAVDPAALQCLPALLAALEISAGIMGVIRRDEELWLMIDADRMIALHRAEAERVAASGPGTAPAGAMPPAEESE